MRHISVDIFLTEAKISVKNDLTCCNTRLGKNRSVPFSNQYFSLEKKHVKLLINLFFVGRVMNNTSTNILKMFRAYCREI